MTEIADTFDTELDIGRPHKRRRWVAVTTTAVVVLAGAGVVYAERGQIWRPPTQNATVDSATATALATVARQDLTAQQQVSGTLGFTGSYAVVNKAQGIVTALPAVGQIISRGQTIYQVDGAPVVLLYGRIPVYRDLAETATGPDVLQLNANLVALGYGRSIDPTSSYFGWATKAGVERLQTAMGVTVDGILHMGQSVFLPAAIRVTTVAATLGAPANGPIAQASGTTRQVVVNLDASAQAQVKVGDQVTITLPNNTTTPGTVTSVGTVATTPSGSGGGGGNSTPTVEVDVTPTDAAATGTLDQAPVQVSITTASAPQSLVVPVNALLSLVGGGYAVEVVAPTGAHRLVAVTIGLFDDAHGLVQVTDTMLRQGDRVLVAGS
jgi:peptidoglycan hydrolase-like protein with peptidoglycan-binding domain